MITINAVSNQLNVPRPKSDITISNEQEYIDGYQKIVEAIHGEKDLSVLVLNRIVFSWFKTFAIRYGNHHVTINDITARHLFEKQTGCQIPPSVTEQEIISSGLLDIHIPYSGSGGFDSYIIEVFLGSFLNKPGALYRVKEIILAYDPENWGASLKRPLVFKAYRTRINEIKSELQADQQKGELVLLEWFEESPGFFLKNLSALRMLFNYPDEIGKRVFSENYPALKQVKIDYFHVPVILQGNDKVTTEIQIHLRNLTQSNKLPELLEQVSGILDVELDSILEVLKMGRVEITPDIVHNIKKRFDPIAFKPQVSQILFDLDSMIPVEKPSSPEKTWEAEKWLSWATNEYLPYRYWLENISQIDDEIGEIANLYSDWLYENYGQLLYNSEFMAWKEVYELSKRIKDYQGPVLFVVLDNFNTKFYGNLCQQLNRQGYYEDIFNPSISILPTFTEVCKKSVVTGHFEPFSGNDYASNIQSTWNKRTGKRVLYVPNIAQLRKVNERNHDLYFLNYLPIDYVLHQQDSNTGISHGQVIKTYLEVLTQDIKAFSNRISPDNELMIIITADHGSTRIPEGTINVIENKFYGKKALDEHHRYISISDDELEALSEQVNFQCYSFNRNQTNLPSNYLVARRLYRFLPTTDSVYIHGGLTPEETIVPVAVFLPAKITPKQVLVHLLSPKTIIAGTRVELEIELTNPNTESIKQIKLEIVDTNIDSASIEVDEIPKLERVVLKVTARCPSNADITSTSIEIRTNYVYMERDFEQMVSIPMEYDTLIKSKFDFKNL